MADFFNFGTHHPEGALQGYRALLGCVAPAGCVFHFLRGLTAFFVLATLIAISIDAGIYNNSAHPSARADAVAWPLYGTSLAQLAALFYFVARACYGFAPTEPYDTGVDAPVELSAAGRAVWVLHTLAMPGVTLSLIVYEAFIKPREFRSEDEACYATVFTVMAVNFMLSNTPLMPKHGLVWLTALVGYEVFIAAYSYFTGLSVYPGINPVVVAVLGAVVYAGLAGALAVREALLSRCFGVRLAIWYQDAGGV